MTKFPSWSWLLESLEPNVSLICRKCIDYYGVHFKPHFCLHFMSSFYYSFFSSFYFMLPKCYLKMCSCKLPKLFLKQDGG